MREIFFVIIFFLLGNNSCIYCIFVVMKSCMDIIEGHLMGPHAVYTVKYSLPYRLFLFLAFQFSKLLL